MATNCEEIQKKDGKEIQQLRFWMYPHKNSQVFALIAVVLVQLTTPTTLSVFLNIQYCRAFRIFLIYCMRRVSCPEHGVVTEKVPWERNPNQRATGSSSCNISKEEWIGQAQQNNWKLNDGRCRCQRCKMT